MGIVATTVGAAKSLANTGKNVVKTIQKFNTGTKKKPKLDTVPKQGQKSAVLNKTPQNRTIIKGQKPAQFNQGNVGAFTNKQKELEQAKKTRQKLIAMGFGPSKQIGKAK